MLAAAAALAAWAGPAAGWGAHVSGAGAIARVPCSELHDRHDDASDWICKSSDNICGLRDKRTLSNPAKVDWDTLLAETPELEEIERKGIDPNSPEGIRLRQKGVERLTKACEAEREANSHCSVWKEISHKDGRTIPDLTELVRARL